MANPQGVLMGNVHLLAYSGASGEEYRFIVLLEEILRVGHRAIRLYLHTQLFYVAYLIIQYFIGQPVFRDTVAQHAACFGSSLKDSNRVASPDQVIGTGQAGRSRADDSHLVRFCFFNRGYLLPSFLKLVVSDKTV